ncbi:hypothetical protein [Bradyrhizobium sp. BWA-3-5]|uniref:hypothetical protein n=1 Tax=Bradyrhizobium sp. BWA-3-5 TaxID=3080013 RepID=UPI003978D65B
MLHAKAQGGTILSLAVIADRVENLEIEIYDEVLLQKIGCVERGGPAGVGRVLIGVLKHQ